MSSLQKILFISVRSDIGGGPKHLFALAQSLKRKKMFFCIASPLDPPYGDKFRETAHKHITLPKRSFSPKAFITLLKLLHTEKITLIHSHGRGAGVYSRLLSLAKKRGSISVIHTFHGVHQEKSLIGRIKVFVDRFLAPFAQKYICVSRDERKKAVQLKFAIPERITVIYNGIDTELIKSQFEQLSIVESRRIFSMNTKCILGTLARLDFTKGLDLALKFTAQIKRCKGALDFSLFVAGAGDGLERTYFQKMISNLGLDEDVFFCGEVEDPLLFLRGLDIYVSFARSEGLPFSVLEAMSCSLPCLLSDILGHRELSKEGGVQLFSLNDPGDFERKITHLIRSDPSVKRGLGRKAFHTVDNHYTEKNMLEKTFSLLNL